MKGIFLGIDVGGTHTDGVAVEGRTILHKIKVPTGDDLQACTLHALRALMSDLPTRTVRRVVLSTTLITNAIIQGRLEPVGTLLTAGPGIDPKLFLPDSNGRVLPGAMDHRGREIKPLDEGAVEVALAQLLERGIRSLAVVGKFSVRNPSHERRIAELAAGRFEHVVLGHSLAGSLNFPRRVATTYLAAAAAPRHRKFVASMVESLQELGIEAPLYLLRADGGTQLATSFRNPAETALSGPAASIMGVDALDPVGGDTLALDIGGTTTDLSLFTKGAPLLEPRGATIGRHLTQIRALYTRSTGAGGDSVVKVQDDRILIGPERLGPPACLGGTHPTPTDALVVLGRTLGDRAPSARALTPIAQLLGLSVEDAARRILQSLAHTIAAAAKAFVNEVNARPVYTIQELLADSSLQPTRAVAVGGPARAIAPYIEDALNVPVNVPNHFDVANAVGAAVARVNLEVHLQADTARGSLTIPELDVFRPIDRSYSLAQAEAEAAEALLTLAREKGILDPGARAEITERESFRIVEGFSTVGNIHNLRAQMRPGILGKVE